MLLGKNPVHLEVLKKIADASIQEGFSLRGISFSPVTGGEGNIEFLFHLTSEDNTCDKILMMIHLISSFEEAYKELL